MPRTRRWSAGRGLALAIAMTAGCDEGTNSRSAEREAVAAAPDASALPIASDGGPSGAKRVPEHRFATLDGAEIGLPDLEGNVAVVNFWGTWCLPCRRELPELAELAAAYADRPVRVVGIAVDSGEPDEIRDFLTEFGVDYTIWLTTMDVAVATFGAVGFPFTILVDPDGWVRKEYLGPQTLASLAPEIDALLP